MPAYLSVDPAVSMDYRPQLYAFLSVDPKGGRGCPSSPLSAVSGQCSARSLASQSQDFVFCLFLLLAHSPDLKKKEEKGVFFTHFKCFWFVFVPQPWYLQPELEKLTTAASGFMYHGS